MPLITNPFSHRTLPDACDGKGRELLHTYDALLAEETDAADRQKLMQQANNAIAEMLKKETQDTLDKVLFELSSQMKNAYSRSDA